MPALRNARRPPLALAAPVVCAAVVGALVGCTGSSPAEPAEGTPHPSAALPASTHATHGRALPPHASAGQLDGRAFPDHVLALTWDDGPDANTLELATYLSREHVSATFFVVGAWVDGVSADPGSGTDVFVTGHHHLPILGDLVALGHRVGNHTLNHVLLTEASPAMVAAQLRENQTEIDPVLTNELRLFRAPGGAWGSDAASVVAGDPYLGQLVGPVRWDVDRKDWEESVECGSSRGWAECDHGGPGGAPRLKPQITAQRYLASIDGAGRGIVLLHDRVGHVGSEYAVEVARALVPQLRARGYVFAAPVLHFSPAALRFAGPADDCSEADRERALDASTARYADVDGDGRADLCGRTPAGLVCARASAAARDGDRMPRAAFDPPRAWGPSGGAPGAPSGSPTELADVDGDGRADACARAADGLTCALADEAGGFRPATRWSSEPLFASAEVRFADVDGDGRADVCARSRAGIACARSGAAGAFERARPWLADASEPSAPFALADVTGDGRADLCVARDGGVACAPSHGDGFARMEPWGAPGAEPVFGDLNGDGRADVCARPRDSGDTVACALSTGRAFTKPTPWLDGAHGLAHLALADISGDGRADLCGSTEAGVVCALAP